MRKNTNVMRALIAMLLAGAMAAPAAAISSGSPAGSDSHETAYLGVHIDEVTPQQASALKLASPSGVVITDLDQDGPACRAGLKENDVIVGLNGSKIESPEQLVNVIHVTQPGKTVTMTVVRSGQTKDVKVTLGKWPQVTRATPHAKAMFPSGAPRWTGPDTAPGMPDIEIPSVAMLSSRHGAMVESLCPQLADYFNVPAGTGVLVRSVEKGSPADTAGLRAGDVILKLNNETVHDMADWLRSMRAQATQISVTFVREKHEQTVVMQLPPPRDSSQMRGKDWEDFEEQMQALGQEMEQLRPDLEASQEMLAAEQPNEKELEQMRVEIEESMKIKREDMEKMTREIEKSIDQKQIEKMTRDIVKSVPTQKQIEQMRHDVEESMKSWTPEFQKQMEELQKQMEQQKLDLQQLMKGFGSEQHEF